MHLQNRCLILIYVFHVYATYEQILQLIPLPYWVWKTKFGEGFFVTDYREKLQNEYKSHRQDD